MTLVTYLLQLLSILMSTLDPKILLGIGIVAFFIWKIPASTGIQTLKAMRKFFLIVFALATIFPCMKIAAKLSVKLDVMFNLNHVLGETFHV